ncbi:related to Probable oxidoreductase AIM17 [Saccharomycodes ludwigii]|uniref:Related to Probable oxidoreductase AIM17 n=1 Tax=Saccharomycodes ludwigii TaxID=36035 RepID=A0A376B8V0_9ASCO|nr:hypothetical protein SCDLUD_002487 [Saccharomycodes ludwigii]KAH3901020.1 hypothetical protein SCDLUD_002487 [Saccharomycodes ludwigii]SSD61123.1 related to Probable oxidoreductase AIM17 [Saccharomycodes ludwigii]
MLRSSITQSTSKNTSRILNSLINKRYNNTISSKGKILSVSTNNSGFTTVEFLPPSIPGTNGANKGSATNIKPLKVCLNNIFLRDASKSPNSVNPVTKQKLFNTGSLLKNIGFHCQPKRIQVSECGGFVNIEWNDGDKFMYPYRFFVKYSGSSEISKLKDNKIFPHRQILWDSTKLQQQMTTDDGLTVDYEKFMNDDYVQYLTLLNMNKYGLAFIKNVPAVNSSSNSPDNDSVLVSIVDKIGGFVVPTVYGNVFKFDATNTDTNTHTNIAFSEGKLPLHNSLTYLENTPGWHLLHSIKNVGDELEGVNYFVDGFNAAKYVRELDTAAYQALTNVPINFRFRQGDRRYYQSKPLIQEHESDNNNVLLSSYNELIKEINYSPLNQAPFTFGIWNKGTNGDAVVTDKNKLTQRFEFEDFLRGLETFEDFIDKPDNQFRIKTPSNTVVIFNNRRVLAGRSGFGKSNRVMNGCFMDNDPTISRLIYLEEKYGKKNLT